MRLSTITFLSLPLTLFITASAQDSGTPTTLEPDTPFERTIGSTETQSFSINLTANQYLQFVVSQHGIDLIVRVFSPTGQSLGKQIINDSQMNPRARRDVLNRMERQAAQNEANQGHMEEALKHVARIQSAQERAQLVGELANQIGSGQKRAQALFLLETARSLLGTSIQGENLPHMNALINLAGAFSRYDSKRGFEMLDPLVDQFNDLSNAAKTLNGFGPEYFVNGELSMQNGNSLATIAYPLSNALGTLSLTDFDRAKSTADRFLLPEVRMYVYLGILQQALVPNGVYSPSAVYWNSLNR